VASGLERLKGELTGATGPGKTPRCWVEPGVVRSVASEYVMHEDGLLYDELTGAFTVTWRGQDIAVPYIEGFTPVEGAVVLLLVQPPSVICLGGLIGQDTGEDT
jgi:hypothetical protein